MKNIVILVLVALMFTACATKGDIAPLVEKTDNLFYEMNLKTLKVQELSTKQAILELEGKQNTQEYKLQKQELASLRGEISSLSKRLLELEQMGKLTQKHVSEILNILKKQKEKNQKILLELEEAMREANEKYNTKGDIIK